MYAQTSAFDDGCVWKTCISVLSVWLQYDILIDTAEACGPFMKQHVKCPKGLHRVYLHGSVYRIYLTHADRPYTLLHSPLFL